MRTWPETPGPLEDPSGSARDPAAFGTVHRTATWAVLVALAVASFALSFSELVRAQPSVLADLFDGREYLSLATNLMTGKGYRVTDGPMYFSDEVTSYRTPGYPWILVGVAKIWGAERLVMATLVLQALVLAAFPALLWLTCSRLSLPPPLALTGALVGFLSLPLRFLSMLIQPELIGAALFLASLALLIWHLRSRSLISAIGCAALLATAILLRQNFVLILALFVFPLPRWLRLRSWLVSAGAVTLILAPWVVRNAVVHHRFPVFVTNGGVNFYLGNSPHIPVDLVGLPHHGRVMRELVLSGLSEVEADRELYRRGWKAFSAQPISWQVKRIFEKIAMCQRDYFPLIHNELFYLLLPFAIAWRKRVVLGGLIAVQFVVSVLIHPVAFNLSGLYYASLVDVVSLKTVGPVALYYFARSGSRGFQLLAMSYLCLLVPEVVYFAADRATYIADALLIPAFAAPPAMVRELAAKFAPIVRRGFGKEDS